MLLALVAPDGDTILHVFRTNSPYLFAGAAFITVALIAAGFATFRRKLDPLLIYFAIFAFLYGLRLWIRSDIFQIALNHSVAFDRFGSAIDFLMPIPALLFLNTLGLLRRFARTLLYFYAAIGFLLAIAVIISGPSHRLDLINKVVSISVLLILLARDLLRQNLAHDSDLSVIRRGLLVFVAFALFDNLRGALTNFRFYNLEPIGFAFFLGALGYVAARRTLQRDHQLAEIQQELEIAKRIQLSILPLDFPPSPNFRVAARYLPMTSVAGDFYDYVFTVPTQAGLLIADVSGHGVPAALIASMVKLAAASQRDHAQSPAKFLAGMNTALCGNTQEQFVTAAYLHLDSESRTFRYAAAGHPPMLLLTNRAVREVQENGLILGIFDAAPYSEIEQPLHHGDRLLLYTDGLMEAANPAGEFFGRERLSALLLDTASLSASDAADRILSSVLAWSSSQEDDLTVVVCDFLHSSPQSAAIFADQKY